jgi:hypothetical protein
MATARNAGAETVAGVSRPPLPSLKLAGTRALVGPLLEPPRARERPAPPVGAAGAEGFVVAVEDAASEAVAVEAVMVPEEGVVAAGAVVVALAAELVDAVNPADLEDEPPHPATSNPVVSRTSSVGPWLMILSIDAD